MKKRYSLGCSLVGVIRHMTCSNVDILKASVYSKTRHVASFYCRSLKKTHNAWPYFVYSTLPRVQVSIAVLDYSLEVTSFPRMPLRYVKDERGEADA